MEMTLEERKKIRMMRFLGGQTQSVDPTEVMANIEADKQKKLERM